MAIFHIFSNLWEGGRARFLLQVSPDHTKLRKWGQFIGAPLVRTDLITRAKQHSRFNLTGSYMTHQDWNKTGGSMWELKCVFTIKGIIFHTGNEQRWVRGQLHSSRVVSFVEFGQEVCRSRLFVLVEITHHVGLLLPDVDGFLQFHFTLRCEWETVQWDEHLHRLRRHQYQRSSWDCLLAACWVGEVSHLP